MPLTTKAHGQGKETAAPSAPVSWSPSGVSQPFYTMIELYHEGGDVANYFRNTIDVTDGFSFHAGTAMSVGEKAAAVDNLAPVFYYAVPETAYDLMPDGTEPPYSQVNDSAAFTLMLDLGGTLGPAKAWQLGAMEFDASGSPSWGTYRPTPTSDRLASYTAWMNYYLNTMGYQAVFDNTMTERGFGFVMSCDHAPTPQWAFDMGADMVLIQRANDGLPDMVTGIAFCRGAARQHGDKFWGVEFSSWRGLSEGPTQYGDDGWLQTGWTTAYFKRAWFQVFMSGSWTGYNEAVAVLESDGVTPSTHGLAMQAFEDYAKVRHPDRGVPFVPMAICQNHYSGFEPSFGLYVQAAYIWYGTQSPTEGDTMMRNLLETIYPGYKTYGTFVTGGPQSIAAYEAAIAAHTDMRPYEPQASTPWGETFDVITHLTDLATLQKYHAVILSLETTITSGFATILNDYVTGGGRVVLAHNHVTSTNAAFTGVTLGSTSGTTGTSSYWVPTTSTTSESNYTYKTVTPTTATVVAKVNGSGGEPLVTKNVVGAGAVYLVTANWMENTTKTVALHVVEKLIALLQAEVAIATVTGPACDYLISVSSTKIYVTILNVVAGTGTWTGTVAYASATGVVKEYWGDTTKASSVISGKVTASVTVPAYDVGVFVLEM